MIKILSVYFFFEGEAPGVGAHWLQGQYPNVHRGKFGALMPLDPFAIADQVPAQVGFAMLDKEASWAQNQPTSD